MVRKSTTRSGEQSAMSKIGQWFLKMQEDAQDMSKKEFIEKHGIANLDIWEDQNLVFENDY